MRGSIRELAESYLAAEGFDVTGRDDDLLVGSRRQLGSDRETLYLWHNEEPAGISRRERSYLTRFGQVSESDPASQKFFLVASTAGLSREFRRDALQWFNVKVRVPAQFFDTAFKWEEASGAPSAAKSLRDRGQSIAKQRVPQPFSSKTSDRTFSSSDLLNHLLSPAFIGEGPPISFIVGAAGAGKSYLFAALYAELYQRFQDDKRAQVYSARPLPLLPETIGPAPSPTVNGLLRAYLDTDFARPLREPVFEWMMTHGAATWLLDGLDEVIVRDPAFFDVLLNLLTVPGATQLPRVTVCVRDSLLVSHEPFKEFVDDYSEYIGVYKLEPWDRKSQAYFADLRLGGRGSEFMRALEVRPEAGVLAETPYYCSLLADEFDAGGLDTKYTATQLLGKALSGIIEREYEKGLLDREFLSSDVIEEFAEGLAVEDMESGFHGVAPQEVRDWAELMIPQGMPDADADRLTTHMLQLALFSPTPFGQIQFSQEILEQYLIARFLARYLNEPEAFIRYAAQWEIPTDSVAFHVLEDAARRLTNEQGRGLLERTQHQPVAFKNLLRLVLRVEELCNIIKVIPLQGLDLSGVYFRDVDLAGVSFRGADVTDCRYVDCDLSNAQFEGAILKGTTFSGSRLRLKGADFGDLANFYTVRTDDGVVADSGRMRAWLGKVTGTLKPILEPCPAALQLRHIFGKFVHPTGQPRRAVLERKGVLAGRRVFSPDSVLVAAIRHGYLTDDDFRGRIGRPQGDSLSELVGFVVGLKMTHGIRLLLDDACDLQGCTHIPRR